MLAVEDGRTVVFHFTGTLPDDEVFDSSRGESPMEVRIGAGQVIPGLESGIMGMRVGETRTFTIAPEQAYGERDEDLCQQVERGRGSPSLSPSRQAFCFRSPWARAEP
jgi:peptidylprolyl isomerase